MKLIKKSQKLNLLITLLILISGTLSSQNYNVGEYLNIANSYLVNPGIEITELPQFKESKCEKLDNRCFKNEIVKFIYNEFDPILAKEMEKPIKASLLIDESGKIKHQVFFKSPRTNSNELIDKEAYRIIKKIKFRGAAKNAKGDKTAFMTMIYINFKYLRSKE